MLNLHYLHANCYYFTSQIGGFAFTQRLVLAIYENKQLVSDLVCCKLVVVKTPTTAQSSSSSGMCDWLLWNHNFLTVASLNTISKLDVPRSNVYVFKTLVGAYPRWYNLILKVLGQKISRRVASANLYFYWSWKDNWYLSKLSIGVCVKHLVTYLWQDWRSKLSRYIALQIPYRWHKSPFSWA